MNLQHFQKLLLAKQQELEQQMAHIEAEALQRNSPDVQDGVDIATASADRDSAWREATREWAIYQQVRSALARLEQGTFGTCLECGRPIEAARLEAVPWAAYCLVDQAQLEAAEQQAGGPGL